MRGPWFIDGRRFAAGGGVRSRIIRLALLAGTIPFAAGAQVASSLPAVGSEPPVPATVSPGVKAPVSVPKGAEAPASVPEAVQAPASVPVNPAVAPVTPAAAPVTPALTVAAQGGSIRGVVRYGTGANAVGLPGVSVTAANTLTGKKYATSTDLSGAYSLKIPRNGRYVVRVELAAFAPVTEEVLLNAAGENGGKPEQVAEFGMELASRVAAAQAKQDAAATGKLASAIGRGLQSLQLQSGDGSGAAEQAAGGGSAAGAQVALPTLGSIGSGAETTGDSYAVSGNVGTTNALANLSEDDIRQRVQDAVAQAQRQGGAGADTTQAVVGLLGGLLSGGGGFGGGGGGRGGRGGGGAGGGGAFRNFNPAQPHGAVFYQGGNGALNAAPFSLTGQTLPKPSYSSNRFGVTFSGSPFIPGILKADTKQFIFFNVTGQRNINPVIFFGTVPTVAERGGDFSQAALFGGRTVATIYDPTTGQPFAGNVLTAASLATPQAVAARALLAYYPAPNVLGSTNRYNYQTVTTAGSNSAQASLRYVRNFGKQAGQLGGGFFGGGGGGGGRGGARQQGPATLRQNINFNGSYAHTAADNRNIFLPLGGASVTDGYNVSAGYTVGYGHLNNNSTVTWNRSHSTNRNYFTNTGADPAVQAGILIGNPAESAGIQGTPFYFGVPGFSLQGFTGLTNYGPQDAINQTISFSDFVSYNRKRHNLRLGFDIRRAHFDSLGGTNVLGQFVFSGYATQNPAAASQVPCTPTAGVTCPTALAASGNSFADFLLGLPQSAAVQAGLEKIYLRQNIFDYYVQDDWRATASLTLNYGLRWEYFSPYVEKNNRLVNLDHNADFSQVAPVFPGGTGISGTTFPRSLVNPDHLLYSPRFGFAYKVKQVKDLVVRGGYGLNFNTGQYAFARQLAFQQPFAAARTNTVTTGNIPGTNGCFGANAPGGQAATLTLANGFACSTVPTQNTYAVNPNYRLGHVQVWNLDVQKTFPLGIVTNLGFNGSTGGSLDLVRAPNRNALNTGVLDPNAQPFNYEDSLGYSRFESLTLNVRKRLQRGISLQATYQYGHSIDNASSIGGSSTVVAQNDLNLNAEEGNSSFDVRHRVNGTWLYELPVGPNRTFLNKGGLWSRVLDGFNISGDYTFASGTYYTPHYQSTIAETSTGSNNSLRPDRNFAVGLNGARTSLNWFNPLAFTAPVGPFGTSSRGSIEGPGTVSIDAAISRTVQLGETRSVEARVSANNVFNTVQYSGIDTTQNSPTFGQVTSTAAQRSLTVLARYRF